MVHEDKRKNTRVQFQASAAVRFADEAFEEFVIADLGLKGGFLCGAKGHKIGETCLITLNLAGAGSKVILSMQGEVVRVDENGLAVHFIEVDLDTFSHLKNIVYFNAANPDAIKEDIF